eukprot:scaffold2959_cov27-Phaeocystis_antarctica.AAC.1
MLRGLMPGVLWTTSIRFSPPSTDAEAQRVKESKFSLGGGGISSGRPASTTTRKYIRHDTAADCGLARSPHGQRLRGSREGWARRL